MGRLFRYIRIFAVLIMMCVFGAVQAGAVNSIDCSSAQQGYVTVNYSSSAKLKVGIQYENGKTIYRDCPSGQAAVFSLNQGDGKYTVTLYKNISGTKYGVVEQKKVEVTIKDIYAPYLVSTADVQFTSGDAVSNKAAEICKNAKTDEQKVVAIYNYMAGRYSFDNQLAKEITSGKITKYIPNAQATLNGNTGICYDLSSLFAAMCRSEGIPCTLTTGYAGSAYHAWNKVNVNGGWYQIDLTYAVTKNVKNVASLFCCVSPLNYTQQSDELEINMAK